MRHRLVLSLTGEHLLMEVLKPSGRPLDVLRSVLRLRSAQTLNAADEAMARVELAAKISVDSLPSSLDQAFSGLKTIYQGVLGGMELEVQLGLDHARIGLMVLADESVAQLTSTTCDAYSQAWVKQMLHSDPSNQEIRWDILSDERKLLLSCVDRQIVEVLKDFSLEYGLRFVSCRPAVLSAMDMRTHRRADRQDAASSHTIVVWTEPGTETTRANSVQLLRFKGTQLASCWRGWVPAPSGALVTDAALDGAIRRFQVRNLAPGGGMLTHVHWPALAAQTAALSVETN